MIIYRKWGKKNLRVGIWSRTAMTMPNAIRHK
jgi:hypothetical protein